MKLIDIIRQSMEVFFNSGTRYEAIDVSSVDYTPTLPFKAIIVGVAGDVEIVGIDGNPVVIPCEEGLHPYGGTGVQTALTTATGIIVVR
jgi:hypothetical protein